MLRVYGMSDEMYKTVSKISKRAKCGVSRTRAIVIREMARGRSLEQAAASADVSPQYARSVVRGFNAFGTGSFPPAYRSGRPHKLDEDACGMLRLVAQQTPKALELPWTTWSVGKLREVALQLEGFPKVCKETVRQGLHRCRISYQSTKTWKQSSDPEFGSKYARIRALYTACPKRSAVVCLDEFGPLECRPYHGKTWAARKKVPRLAATYHRTEGVRHMLAFYDVHADVLGGSIYPRKRGEEFLEFLRDVRSMYPKQVRLYLVMDNFSPHKRNDVAKWAEENHAELVFTATNASWMNRIESHFGALRRFALEGTHPQNHDQLAAQIEKYLRWRNRHRRDPELLSELSKIRVA